MNETIDTDTVMAIATTERQHVSLFGTNEPTEVIEKATAVATALKTVIVKQGLVSTISGKQYPRCEAWTLLGTMLGVFPVCQWTKRIDDGWEARVEARTRDGGIVGSAEAQCLKTERNWASRDDFALRSMAQTRATAKALRMPLGFVMTLAGYEPTPAEEMVADHPKNPREEYLPLPEAAKAVDVTPKDKPTAPVKAATEITRQWWIEQFNATIGAEGRAPLLEFCIKAGMILPTEQLEDVPLRFVPTNRQQLMMFEKALDLFVDGSEKAEPPFVNTMPAPTPKQQPIDVSKSNDWRTFPVPFGKNAGIALGNLQPNQLSWYCKQFKVEPIWVDKDGKEHQRKPESLAKDTAFRKALDEAMEELGAAPQPSEH